MAWKLSRFVHRPSCLEAHKVQLRTPASPLGLHRFCHSVQELWTVTYTLLSVWPSSTSICKWRPANMRLPFTSSAVLSRTDQQGHLHFSLALWRSIGGWFVLSSGVSNNPGVISSLRLIGILQGQSWFLTVLSAWRFQPSVRRTSIVSAGEVACSLPNR